MNHGTRTGYRRGCRCADCRDAQRRSVKRYRVAAGLYKDNGTHHFARRLTVPAHVVQAHVASLVSSGWTVAAITAELGLHRETVPKIVRGARTAVRATTAAAILGLDPLPAEVGVDEVVVDRLLSGADWRDVGATREERIAAALEALRRPDVALADIERRLGLRAGRDFPRRAA